MGTQMWLCSLSSTSPEPSNSTGTQPPTGFDKSHPRDSFRIYVSRHSWSESFLMGPFVLYCSISVRTRWWAPRPFGFGDVGLVLLCKQSSRTPGRLTVDALPSVDVMSGDLMIVAEWHLWDTFVVGLLLLPEPFFVGECCFSILATSRRQLVADHFDRIPCFESTVCGR